MTFAEFIAQKGVEKLSGALKTPRNTIYSWRHLNLIPRKVWPDLMVALPEVGLSDLLAMEAAASESAIAR